MIDYLLGKLSESEIESLEKAYFGDHKVFDQLVAVEHELVDAYARGRLSPAEQKRFEQYYVAHHDRSERARFASAFVSKIDSIHPRAAATESPKWWSHLRRSLVAYRRQLTYAAALACLLLLAVSAWFFMRSRRAREELVQSQLERTERENRARAPEKQKRDIEAKNDNVAAVASSPSPRPTQSAIATSPVILALTVGSTRGPESQTHVLRIPQGTQRVNVHLTMKENDYPKYDVIVQPVGRAPITIRRGLTPVGPKSGATIGLSLPSRLLSSGDYMLTLRGVAESGEVEDISKSLFRVEKNHP